MTVGADPRIGSELLGYRIEALLGRGGMSVVYRPHHVALDRKVALKLLVPELAEDERFRERFLRESKLAASLDERHATCAELVEETREALGLHEIVLVRDPASRDRRLPAQPGKRLSADALACVALTRSRRATR